MSGKTVEIQRQFISRLTKNKFLQLNKNTFSQSLLDRINTLLEPNLDQEQTIHEKKLFGYKIIEANELCLSHLVHKVTQLQSEVENSSLQFSSRSINKQINQKDYQILQQAVQKAEKEVRKHIGIQHQMKLCLQEIEDEMNELTAQTKSLKKENSFLRQELAAVKKKEIEVTDKLNIAQKKIQDFHKNRLNNINKVIMEPQLQILHDGSRESFHKSFDNKKEKTKKRMYLTKNNDYPKLGSRKTSKLDMIQAQIDVNLNNFITLSTQLKNQHSVIKTQGKQTFWNKRLKKKQSETIHNTYADLSTIQLNPNRSLNISPRQLRKKQKQKELKEAYAINLRESKKEGVISSNQGSLIKKKQRQQYSNGESYQVHKSLKIGTKNPDRSRSVVY